MTGPKRIALLLGVAKRVWRPVLLMAGVLGLPPRSAWAHPGVGIVLDGRGRIFYTDLSNVWMIAPDGHKSIAVRNVHTHELYLDPGGSLYGEHLWYEGDATKKWGYRVWRLSPDGTLSDVIPAREGFRTGFSFVRDAAGNQYRAEGEAPPRIVRRAPDGTEETLATCGDCRDIRWMTATKGGTVYFIDAGDLRLVSPSGVLGTLARGLGRTVWTQFQVGERHALMGLWTDAAGNVYVARYGTREVLRVAADGTVRVVARSRIPWSPTGGLVAPDGALLLLEYSVTNSVRVRRIARDGTITTY